jgi:hypothetical protein
MTQAPRLLVHRTPGETRAAAFDRHGKPFRLFLERWDAEAARLQCGDVVEARLRRHASDQGGSFFEASSGQEIFVRSRDVGKRTEGASAPVEIIAEARAGKLARGRPATGSRDEDTSTPLQSWAARIKGAPAIEEASTTVQFDRIDSAFDEALSMSCPLPGGGNIGLERTRALTAIDIDTAGRAGKGSAGARAFSVNREAVAETARQLSLRNLGGLVVIDCVAPVTSSSADKLKPAFIQAFASYSSRQVEALKPSAFGLLEAQLEWAEAPIADRLLDESGQPTPETELLALFRAAARETAANRSGFYRLTLSANALGAYIARRKHCDQLLKNAFSGRVSIASGKGEKSVVRKE